MPKSPAGFARDWSTVCASTIPMDWPTLAGIWRGCASLLGPDAWIVIEKILAVDEALEPTLPVDGTTGYDVLREVGGVFVDPAGASALTELSSRPSVDYHAMPTMLAELKIHAATDTLASELRRLRRSIVAAAGTDHPLLPEAVAALLSHIEVYRSDYPGLAAVLPAAFAETQAAEPELGPALQVIAAALARGGEPADPAATTLRRGDRQGGRGLHVLPRCPPGVAQRGGRRTAPVRRRRRRVSPQRRHPAADVAADDDHADHPRHQTRRGCARPDRRAVPGAVAVDRVPGPLGDRRALPRSGDRISSCGRTSSASGRSSGQVTDELRGRLHAYAEKAIREAAWHTSWNDPDAAFEEAVHGWLDAVSTAR